MASRRDFYDVLGVGRDASADELQRAYRKLARTYHPDVNSTRAPRTASRRCQRPTTCSATRDQAALRRLRARLPPGARGHRPGDLGTGAGGAGSQAAGQAEASAPWAGRRPGTCGSPPAARRSYIEDLLGELFGRRGRGRGRPGWGPISGADQEVELQITLEEAVKGEPLVTWPAPTARSVEVTIPVGVTDGQRIRLADQGGHGTGGAAPGDLYLVVRIAPHPRFRLNGRDVAVDLQLAPWEAALGASVVVDTPTGEAKVQVPPGSSTGRRLRLRGQGAAQPARHAGRPVRRDQGDGPPKLGRRERQLFEELAGSPAFDPRRQS